MNNRWFHIVSLLCMVIISVAVLTAMYMLADGVYFHVPFQLKNGGVIKTTQTLYYPGDEVEATFNYCKSRDISGFVDWQLVDTYIRFYQPQRINLPMGCNSFNIDLGVVPPDIGRDTFHFTGTMTYRINSLTSVSYTLISNNFTVVPR